MTVNLRSAIQLYDGVTGPMRSMHNAMSLVVSSFENMQDLSSNAVDISSLQAAQEELASVCSAITAIEDGIRQAQEQQQRFNQDIRNGGTEADQLLGKIKQFVGAFAGIAAVRKAKNWMQESLGLTDTQLSAERQLQTVLKNVGAAEDAFDSLKQTASSIQGYSLYGDEAMIGGAAELATYIKDADAIESMMHTLANYSAGMSGGGEVSSQQMVDYATQLGKALDDTYDGLKKKGFELTDVQKEIIENGTDMEKALVLDEVISQSWAGLAQQMANLPEGQIIQMKNLWGDLREEVGAKLYPHVMRFVNVIRENMPAISSAVMGFGNILGYIIVTLSGIIGIASEVATVFIDNWSWISPIVWGIVAALAAYQMASKGVAIAQGIATAAKMLAVPVYSLMTGAVMAETAAQWGLNADLYACPIVWILIIIIAVIAAIYAIVAAVNKLTGSSISATGIIMGVFFTMGAHIYNNTVVPLWNAFAAFANFFANLFNDPVAAVKVLFYDMAQIVIGYILNMATAIESVINKIPGVTVDITSGLDNFYKQLESASQQVKDESSWVEVVGKLEYKDYGEAAMQGYAFGEGLADKVGGFFDSGDLDVFAFDDAMAGMGGMADDIGGISGDTGAIRDSVEVSSETLKYMRDLAEQEVINRFTTAEIKTEVTNNNYINSDMDVDGVVSRFADGVEEAMFVMAEGVHS